VVTKSYVSIFKNSKVESVTRYGEEGPEPKGTVMSSTFQPDGREFFALNDGPQFTFSPAISFFVNCQTQQEVDAVGKDFRGGRKTKMRLANIFDPTTGEVRSSGLDDIAAWFIDTGYD
jgi:predicted 3-demethylubiquinone-9 3-methyltransferase (glyoxalase superfamily)